MANRTFLLSTDSSSKPSAERDRIEILCAVSYRIAVFWYLLFDRSSLINAVADTKDGGKVEYPYLTQPGPEAIAHAKNRWPVLRNAIGPRYDDVFATWLRFVEQRSQGFLQCETLELWWMYDDTPSFRRHIELSLGALSEPQTLSPSAAWRELLSQVDCRHGNGLSPEEVATFCGYSWQLPVPWE